MALVKFWAWATMAVSIFDMSFGYRTGAPASENLCITMHPLHGVDAQSTPCPYRIWTDKLYIKNNEKLTVNIKGDIEFKGFLVQARDSHNTTLGSFHAVAGAKTMNCFEGENNAVTHTGDKPLKEISIPWTCPPEGSLQFNFVMTVVKDKETFWVNVKSDTLNVDRD